MRTICAITFVTTMLAGVSFARCESDAGQQRLGRDAAGCGR